MLKDRLLHIKIISPIDFANQFEILFYLALAASVNAPDIGRRDADDEDAVVSRRGVKDIRMTAMCDGNQTVEINVRLAGTRFPGIEKVM